ncbi:MAG: ABC transporter ATP-binding protein [Clostridiales bacterium]|nr:ABC transporter ATP-binding protein [Clostridiales bacterium]
MIAIIKRILKITGKYKGKVKLAFLFSFIKSMLSKAPIMLAFIMLSDFMEKRMTAEKCLFIGIAVVVCILLQALCQNIADRLQSATGFVVFSEKRKELGAHLRKMPMGYFTEGNIGKISSVLSTDMVFAEENCMTALADMMSEIFAEIIMLVFMLFFNVYLGITAILVVLIAMPIASGMRKDALQDSTKRQEQSENLTEAVLDFVEGIGITKTYNLLGEKSKDLTENFQKSCETNLDFEISHGPWQRGLNLVYGLGAVGIIGLSFLLYNKGMMSAMYVIGMMLFVFDLFGPLKALYGQSTRLTVMSSCLDRMEEVFQEAELTDDGREHLPKSAEGKNVPEIEFQHVRFGYGEKEVLHDISFTLEKNHMMALVGPSGGGKSTIANLLTRFWDVKEGQILVRGKDIRKIPLSELMDQMSVVFQRVYLFQDTIYNNISMGRPEATREEVIEAAKKARCYDFIMSLPEQFETVIGEGGASLSGGEKQRISIARCILKDAPIVILDEATASVDTDNESYIQQAISELCKGKTLLVIAHRLNTIRNADQIMVIADGRIAERGTHEELLQKNGIYHNFVTVRENTKGWYTKK